MTPDPRCTRHSQAAYLDRYRCTVERLPCAPYSGLRLAAAADKAPIDACSRFALCCGRRRLLSEANVSPPWTVQVSSRRRAGAPLNRTRPSLSTSLWSMGVPSSRAMKGKALPFLVVLSREGLSSSFRREWFKLTSARGHRNGSSFRVLDGHQRARRFNTSQNRRPRRGRTRFASGALSCVG